MFSKIRPSHIFVDNWKALDRSIFIYRNIAIALSALVIIVIGTLVYQVNQPPLVIAINQQGDKQYFWSDRKNIAVTDVEIKNSISRFIKARYVWGELTPQTILNQLNGLATSDLLNLTHQYLKHLKNNEFKEEQKVSQDISHLKIIHNDKKIEAYFDKIIKVNGIPLVVATNLRFLLKIGKKTHLNPIGLYISKVIETTGEIK